MNRTLRVLHVEDQERDVALLTRHLSRAGYDLTSERVETAAAMNLALGSREWDVILCDYSMPHFNALSALSTLKETGLDIPLIIISGTVGEAVAVEAMRAGAHDYLMKDNLVRLAPTIERELHEAENRRARKRAEESLKASGAELRALFTAITDVIFVFDAEGRYLRIAPTGPTGLYKPPAGRVGKTLHDVFPKDQADLLLGHIRRAVDEGQMQRAEYSLQVGAGEIWFDGSVSPLSQDSVVWVARDITERKRAEEVKRKLLHDLAERVKELTALHEAARILQREWANTSTILLELAELLPHAFQYPEIAHARIRLGQLETATQGFTDSPLILRAEFTTADGQTGIIEVVYTENRPPEAEGPFLREERSLINTLADMLRTAYDRRQTEMALRESEGRFRQLAENIREVFWMRTPEINEILYVSPAYESIWGRARESLSTDPRSFMEAVHPEDRQRVVYAMENEQKQGFELEYRIIKPDGRLRWVWDRGFPVKDESGRVYRIAGIAEDITERKQAEQELKKSEERYRDLVENARDIIYTTDLEGNYTSVNRAGEHLFGYTREEALKMSQAQVVVPEHLEKSRQMLARKLAGESETVYELEAITKDGSRITIEINTRLIYRDGVPVGVQGIGRDVTERKRAEEMLRAADRRAVEEYERLLDRLASLALSFGTSRDLLTIYRGLRDFSLSLTPSFALVICLYDGAREVREGVYFYTNGEEMDIAEQVTMPVRSGPAGRAIKTGTVVVSNDYLKDLRDRDPLLIGFEQDDSLPQSALIAPMTIMGRTIGTIEVQSYELAAYTREHVTAMQMAANLAANAVDNVRLLNLEREKEEQLRQSQKMEAVGQLAGGIAHDFNNLLTAITGYSELTLRRLQAEDPLYRNVTEIKKAGERAASLTRQLLAFSRKQVLQPKVLALNSIISEVEKMLSRLIGEDIELRTVLEPQLGSIKADPGQIEQVLLNLAVNARDAMPHGGKLTIETGNVYLDGEYAKQHIAVNPGHYVMLAVSDSGTGMDEKTQARIFEPFFTTKEAGKGTGLGLSTVYGIVKQSGGNIWVYSEVGRGTSFKVYLPHVDEGAQEYKRSAEPEDALQGTEMILLAEDEEMVRKLAREVLEMYGYKVLEAANGGAALLICERHQEPIDLLITDVIMPEMGGRELADRLSQLRPEMKVLYMSGYTDNAIVHQGVLDEGANFIQKPFSPQTLASKVREVLGETKRDDRLVSPL
jgi:PAS domain S-box-containing protein